MPMRRGSSGSCLDARVPFTPPLPGAFEETIHRLQAMLASGMTPGRIVPDRSRSGRKCSKPCCGSSAGAPCSVRPLSFDRVASGADGASAQVRTLQRAVQERGPHVSQARVLGLQPAHHVPQRHA
eukprot:229501-Rhodomonas_salina.1